MKIAAEKTLKPTPAAGQQTPVHSALLQRKCDCGRVPGISGDCDSCQNRRLQRQTSEKVRPSEVPSNVYDVLRLPGQPLDPQTRAYMEPRLGHDLSKVRVHTDERAGESARAVTALAYTVGQHIVFGPGQFSPTSSSGKTLLAHELAHVIQQGSGEIQPGAKLEIGAHDDRFEGEADRIASQINTVSPTRTASQLSHHMVPPEHGARRTPLRAVADDPPLPGGSAMRPVSTLTAPNLLAAPKLQKQESREGWGTPGACVVREDIPSSRGGIVNSGGTVGERFQVNIDWRDSPPEARRRPGSYCDCACGEYRQYVKGHLIINGRRETWHLWGGAVLEEDVYHEDGLDRNPDARYGHRREPLTMNEDFRPDRASGCSYEGRDFPRVMIGSDTDMLFKFKGQTYDVCNHTFGPIHEWEVRYAGPINR